MKDSLYHSLLRVTSLTVALVLLFESGLMNPVTKEMSQVAHQYLMGAVGATASVAPTELNQMTAKLTQMERDLQTREAALKEREIAVDVNTAQEPSENSDVAIYILSVILFILLVLIVLNYFLDYLRRNPVPRKSHEQTT